MRCSFAEPGGFEQPLPPRTTTGHDWVFGSCAPLGQYSQITRVKASEFLFIAGSLSADKAGNSVGVGDFDTQCVQVFANIEKALAAEGAGWGNVLFGSEL